MKRIFVLLAMAGIAGLSGCAARPIANNDYAVKVAYAYAASDQSTNAWRAFMIALDECHNEGYQDAYLAAHPSVHCDQLSGNACTRFVADAAYDCVGLGY